MVHAIERNATRPVTVERFLWYAPVIGGFVRGQQKVVRDGEILAERSYELLDIAENCLNSREGNPVPLRLAMERQGAL